MYQHTKERGSFLKLFTLWTFLGKEQTFYRDLLSSYLSLIEVTLSKCLGDMQVASTSMFVAVFFIKVKQQVAGIYIEKTNFSIPIPNTSMQLPSTTHLK
jgi:hypothetical protein